MPGSYYPLVARFNGARASTRSRAGPRRGRGGVLVKEYKDDGHTGTLLDRPALNQLRADLKTDLFDIVSLQMA
jgi:DNA invertase Pin-like site-specific DNA recombinase